MWWDWLERLRGLFLLPLPLALSPLFLSLGVSLFEQLILENVERYFTFSLKEFFGSFGFWKCFKGLGLFSKKRWSNLSLVCFNGLLKLFLLLVECGREKGIVLGLLWKWKGFGRYSRLGLWQEKVWRVKIKGISEIGDMIFVSLHCSLNDSSICSDQSTLLKFHFSIFFP